MTESGMSYCPGRRRSPAGRRRPRPGAAPGRRRPSARGHLDDVPEDVVGGGVQVLDLLELLAQAERDRLLAQVGQLAAGDLVAVDAAGRRGQAGLERRVQAADRLPVGLEVAHRPQRQAGVAGRCAVAATSDDSDGWLVVPAMDALAASTASTPASMAASRVASWPPAVSWVCRCTGRSNRSRSAVDQRRRGRGAQQAGHVLDREDVRAGVDDPFGQPQVVVERVEPSRPGRTGRRCSRARPRRRPCRCARTASMAGRIWLTSLSASKMRKMSMPVAAASSTNASVTAVG